MLPQDSTSGMEHVPEEGTRGGVTHTPPIPPHGGGRGGSRETLRVRWRSAIGNRWISAALAAVVGGLGLMMAHHPMLLSGLQRVQVNLGDTRFNNYVLEHAYRWLIGARHHGEFWNPPFYYPAR